MKISKSLLTAAALVASFSASAGAQVSGAILGGPIGTFLSLSAPAGVCTGANCTLGPGVGTIVGGNIYQTDLPFADIPAGAVFQNRFLAAGPTATEPATLSFLTNVRDVSFLWGSPDLYNRLRVNTTAGFVDFTAAGLSFPVTNGNQSFSQYVRFTANAGVSITGLVFSNNPSIDAFEAANFSVNVVPEPSTYALMAAGLAALALVSKRRKQA